MAKRQNKTQQLERLFSAIAGSEVRVTAIVAECIRNVYQADGVKHSALGHVYNALTNVGEKVRPAQRKAVDEFVNKFVAVGFKKIDGAIVLTDGKVTLVKNNTRHASVVRDIMGDQDLTAEQCDAACKTEQFFALLEAKIAAWLQVRNGNLFAKEKKVDDRSEEQKLAEKRAKIAGRFETIGKDIIKLDMSQLEKADHLLTLARQLGFNSLTDMQSVIDNAAARTVH